jgi:hypothetical protein
MKTFQPYRVGDASAVPPFLDISLRFEREADCCGYGWPVAKE